MGFEKQVKPKWTPMSHLECIRKIAGGCLLISLFYVAGCVKEYPLANTRSPESPTPSVVKMNQKTQAMPTPVSQEEATAAIKPVEEAVEAARPEALATETAPEIPVPELREPPQGQLYNPFHLKPIEARPPYKKEEMIPVSPKILEDKTIKTKMPQAVADLAAKSKMYHSIHLPVNKGDSCTLGGKCHKQMTKRKYVHAPVAAGACMVCHANMSKDPPFGLVSTGVDLCWGCHKNQKISVINSKYLHKTLKHEGCISCHDSHGSDTSKYDLKKDELALCIDCHKEKTKKVIKYIENSKVVHKPVAERRCAGCHSPHASNFNKLLKAGPDDTVLCFSCHKKMEERAERASYKHGPIRKKLCRPCHEPHAGRFVKDLKYNFGKQFYNSFNLEVYSLCFKCHKETVVLEKRTTNLTNFRNGDRNLHFLHVNRKKGRTCLSCHEVHMGSQMRHIRKSTPFGRWEIPINFTCTLTGGKCLASCHVAKEYDRKNPVKLLIDEEEKKSVVGKKSTR